MCAPTWRFLACLARCPVGQNTSQHNSSGQHSSLLLAFPRMPGTLPGGTQHFPTLDARRDHLNNNEDDTALPLTARKGTIHLRSH